MAVRVDVISDVICPWCYVGKRPLEKAIALSGRRDVCLTIANGDVVEALRRWEPAQLDYGEQLRVHGQRVGNRSQFN